MTIIMAAKYSGTCIRCRKNIDVGFGIEYEPGVGSWHVECAHLPVQPKPERPPVNAPLGTFTVVFDGDDYQTIRLKSPRDGNFAGRVLAEYMSGPDNELSFTAFGEVVGDEVRVWRRFADTPNKGRWVRAVYAVLTGGERDAAGLRYALASNRCCRCNKTLTVPASIHAGMGPDCASKGWE